MSQDVFVFPASFSQQRLWFLDRLVPSCAAYNIALAVTVQGDLQIDHLHRSLQELARRHETLRTTFASLDGVPVQVIAPTAEVALALSDLQHLPAQAQQQELQKIAANEGGTPFDLARGPLWRARLARLHASQYVIFLTMHHIISDGWSLQVMLREIGMLYEARIAGRDSSLPELTIQYADFARWQQERLQGEYLEREVAFWRERLAGDLPPIALPTDYPRPAVYSFRGTHKAYQLPLSLAQTLRQLSQRQGTTLFMTLLTAFYVLLQRYSGTQDIVVGTPVAGRPTPETEALIGFFVNTLALRAHVPGNVPFSTLLQQVRENCLAAYSHAELPFEKLIEVLRPQRHTSHTPLFQVMFVLQNTPSARVQSGLTMTSRGIDTRTSKFDFTLELAENEDGLAAVFTYNTDLFAEATIDRMFHHYHNLLAAAAANPEAEIGRLDMLGEEERKRIVEGWNDTSHGQGEERIHDLFFAQAARTPEALAVVSDTGRLTYRQLACQVLALSERLRQHGVGRGAYVAVYMKRSCDMVVAVLAVLQTGAAYVPLELSYPLKRLVWIVESLPAHCLLTQTAQRAAADELCVAAPCLRQVVCVDSDAVAAESLCHNDSSASCDDIAYCIFTSGSTGMPKGVMVQHRPAVNLIRWVNHTFAVNADDSVLFVTSLCFDLSVYDIFGVLAAGGKVRVVADEDLRDAHKLLSMLDNEAITLWDSAPAALGQIVPLLPSRASQKERSRLRLVLLSGDWIPVAMPDQIRAAFPRAQVIGLGGATEATVWSNFYPIGVVDKEWVSIPYGRPIWNARYHVLDADLNPCPVRVAGDLYIGGECLALGYTDAALTAEKFIPDPFRHEAGKRIYRTGDRARYWADGTIEFLGRLDQQVKIRGFRIELGEIETALAQHPQIGDNLVIAREDTPGDKRLVAYLVTRHGQPLSAAELRSFLRERLPEYMLPAAFVMLEKLPLTANGKVDRRALPPPDSSRNSSSRDYVAPAGALQERLAAIWQQVLQIDNIGMHDDFFEFGGHSLLVVRMVAQVQQQFGVDIPIVEVFARPTLAQLVPIVENLLLEQIENMSEEEAQKFLQE